MMTGTFSLPLALLAGFALGLLFYGGLWVTIRRFPKSRHPALLALVSFWGRTALVVAGLILVTAHRWQNAIAGLAGFLAARIVLARRMPRADVVKEVK